MSQPSTFVPVPGEYGARVRTLFPGEGALEADTIKMAVVYDLETISVLAKSCDEMLEIRRKMVSRKPGRAKRSGEEFYRRGLPGCLLKAPCG